METVWTLAHLGPDWFRSLLATLAVVGQPRLRFPLAGEGAP